MIFRDDETIKAEVIAALGEDVPMEVQILAGDPGSDAIWVLMDLLQERGWCPPLLAVAHEGIIGESTRVLVREAVAHAVLRMGPGARGEFLTMVPPEIKRLERLGTSVSVTRYWPVDGRIEMRLKIGGIGHTFMPNGVVQVAPGNGREMILREDGRTVFRGLLLSIGAHVVELPVGKYAIADMVCAPIVES